ncbi:MAG: hypothetical protein KC476_08020, partial [Cyanobacteria bacterium HKST-UBA06]|nr:hypothetical protein [Cyanobacteria bacterium HKST-UBA06]
MSPLKTTPLKAILKWLTAPLFFGLTRHRPRTVPGQLLGLGFIGAGVTSALWLHADPGQWWLMKALDLSAGFTVLAFSLLAACKALALKYPGDIWHLQTPNHRVVHWLLLNGAWLATIPALMLNLALHQQLAFPLSTYEQLGLPIAQWMITAMVLWPVVNFMTLLCNWHTPYPNRILIAPPHQTTQPLIDVGLYMLVVVVTTLFVGLQIWHGLLTTLPLTLVIGYGCLCWAAPSQKAWPTGTRPQPVAPPHKKVSPATTTTTTTLALFDDTYHPLSFDEPRIPTLATPLT